MYIINQLRKIKSSDCYQYMHTLRQAFHRSSCSWEWDSIWNWFYLHAHHAKKNQVSEDKSCIQKRANKICSVGLLSMYDAILFFPFVLHQDIFLDASLFCSELLEVRGFRSWKKNRLSVRVLMYVCTILFLCIGDFPFCSKLLEFEVNIACEDLDRTKEGYYTILFCVKRFSWTRTHL
jgi:hypothetical protein